jgi:hypothetical protein
MDVREKLRSFPVIAAGVIVVALIIGILCLWVGNPRLKSTPGPP